MKTILFGLLAVLVPGCAGLDWALEADPASGIAPAMAALTPAADAGLEAWMSGGLLEGSLLAGALAFVGTYGKTIFRYYKTRQAQKIA